MAGRGRDRASTGRSAPGNGPAHRSVYRYARLDRRAAGVQGRPEEIEREDPRNDSDGLARGVSGFEVLTRGGHRLSSSTGGPSGI